MQNISFEKLKSDVARYGYHGKPIDTLIKSVTTLTNVEFQKTETSLLIKKDKLSKNAELLTNQKKIIKKKVGETRVIPDSTLLAITGIFFASILYYLGSIENTITAATFLGIGVLGAVIVHLMPVDSDFWRPILFTSLSLLIIIMQCFLLYYRGIGLGQAIIFSMPLGIMAYLLNRSLFDNAFTLMDQSKAIWYRISSFINRSRITLNIRSKIRNQRNLEAVVKKKNLVLQNRVNILNNEYKIANLAFEIKKKKLAVTPLGLNGKEHNYAN